MIPAPQIAGGRAPVILCVDDEEVGLLVRRIMLERAGYKVLTAEGGLEAIALFADNSVDVVVLDYSMPGMNGGDVADELKKRRPEVPIVLLSAYVNMPEDVLGKVDHYMVKGDGAPVLLQRLSDVLSQPTGGAAQ